MDRAPGDYPAFAPSETVTRIRVRDEQGRLHYWRDFEVSEEVFRTEVGVAAVQEEGGPEPQALLIHRSFDGNPSGVDVQFLAMRGDRLVPLAPPLRLDRGRFSFEPVQEPEVPAMPVVLAPGGRFEVELLSTGWFDVIADLFVDLGCDPQVGPCVSTALATDFVCELGLGPEECNSPARSRSNDPAGISQADPALAFVTLMGDDQWSIPLDTVVPLFPDPQGGSAEPHSFSHPQAGARVQVLRAVAEVVLEGLEGEETLRLSARNPWLLVRVDGSEGWVREQDFPALGLHSLDHGEVTEIGPFRLGNESFIVALTSIPSRSGPTVGRVQIRDERGRLHYTREFDFRWTEHSVGSGVVEGASALGLLLQHTDYGGGAEGERTPDIQIFALRGDRLVPLFPPNVASGPFGSFSPQPSGDPDRPVRLHEGDVLEMSYWSGWFYVTAPLAVDLGCYPARDACVRFQPIGRDPTSGLALVRVSGEIRRPIEPDTEVRLFPAPRASSSETITVQPGSRVEIVHAAIDPSYSEVWLRVRIDGREGWVDDVSSIGLGNAG